MPLPFISLNEDSQFRWTSMGKERRASDSGWLASPPPPLSRIFVFIHFESIPFLLPLFSEKEWNEQHATEAGDDDG